jgi:prepilin-type N-terminal cleavage/methylation domain-containing protein
MKGLREKFRNKKGFTLVEMLIVVAIIAILIAVSIPLVNSSLEEARHATDDANYRSAAVLGSIKVLTEAESAKGDYIYVVNDSSQGKLVETAGTKETPVTAQCKCGDTTENATLKVEIDEKGEVTVSWQEP